MPGQNDLLDAYQQAQQDYAAHGIATVQDGMMVEQLAPFYRALVDQGRLELDVVYPTGMSGIRWPRRFPPPSSVMTAPSSWAASS